MTDFGELMQERAQAASEKPAPDVDMVSYILDTYPDLANLAAQLEEMAETDAVCLGAGVTPSFKCGRNDCGRCAALAACKEFQEKYS